MLGTLWGQTKLRFNFRGHLLVLHSPRGPGWHEEGRAGGEGGDVRSVVVHSLWKASEVDSDQTLHVYIVKHDPFCPAKVVVGVSIALHALLLALSQHLSSKAKSRPPRGPRSASQT